MDSVKDILSIGTPAGADPFGSLLHSDRGLSGNRECQAGAGALLMDLDEAEQFESPNRLIIDEGEGIELTESARKH